MEGLANGRTEVVPSPPPARVLVTVLSFRVCASEYGDSFLSLLSSGLRVLNGVLLSVSSNAREGRTFRDGGEVVTGCSWDVGCRELAGQLGPGPVTPPHCAARASFEAGILDNLNEGVV